MKPTEPGDQDATITEAVKALRRWENTVDAVQAAKLASARRRALAAAAPRPWSGGWPAAAMASLLLALGLAFWPRPLVVVPPPSVALEAPEGLAASADEADGDELLDDDLDFSLALSGLDEAT